MMPIATFPTLDEAESALDWIGIDFTDGEGAFEGELAGDDRDLLEIAASDPEAPMPVRSLARGLLDAWDESGGVTLPYRVAYTG